MMKRSINSSMKLDSLCCGGVILNQDQNGEGLCGDCGEHTGPNYLCNGCGTEELKPQQYQDQDGICLGCARLLS